MQRHSVIKVRHLLDLELAAERVGQLFGACHPSVLPGAEQLFAVGMIAPDLPETALGWQYVRPTIAEFADVCYHPAWMYLQHHPDKGAARLAIAAAYLREVEQRLVGKAEGALQSQPRLIIRGVAQALTGHPHRLVAHRRADLAAAHAVGEQPNQLVGVLEQIDAVLILRPAAGNAEHPAVDARTAPRLDTGCHATRHIVSFFAQAMAVGRAS
jgi:hypothetical protein